MSIILNVPPEVIAVSFDVFDTVITRATAEPKGIFMEMAARICQHPELARFSDDFAVSRISAEVQCRSRGDREITLDQIYTRFTNTLGISESSRNFLYGLELATERENCRPVAPVIQLVQNLREQGLRIIFVSDMYLPETFVRELLESVDAYRRGDRLYVSSSIGFTKQSGKLFREVLANESLRPRELFHYGDNLLSDLVVPQRLGIVSDHCTVTGLSSSEQSLLEADSDNLVAQKSAGACRSARLLSPYPAGSHSAALYLAGADIAGPILHSYVCWILSRAREDRIERLYFIARDGQILREIALRLAPSSRAVPELRYLYGSRQAWHLPGTLACDAATADWILLADPFISLTIIAQRGELDRTKLVKALMASDFSVQNLERQLSKSELAKLRDLLCRPSPLQKLLNAAASSARERAVAYFQSEGLFDENVRWGIVDLGWHGNLQDSLQRILESAGYKRPIVGYYFGLLRNDLSECCKKAYFFTSKQQDEYFDWGSACMTILELLASGDHGPTRGYRRMWDGTVAPDIDQGNELVLRWGLEYLRAGIFGYVSEFRLFREEADSTGLRELLLPLIRRFCTSPPREVAAALGSFPFSSDQAETSRNLFAPPITLFQAIFFLANYAHPRRFKITYWIHGSKVQSGFLTRGVLDFASRLFWLVNRLIRRVMAGT